MHSHFRALLVAFAREPPSRGRAHILRCYCWDSFRTSPPDIKSSLAIIFCGGLEQLRLAPLGHHAESNQAIRYVRFPHEFVLLLAGVSRTDIKCHEEPPPRVRQQVAAALFRSLLLRQGT